MDTETRERLDHTLNTAKEDDLVLLAVMDAKGAVIHTLRPDADRLVDLGSSLLDQALDLLREQGADETDLAEKIENALEILPDRFADPADAA